MIQSCSKLHPKTALSEFFVSLIYRSSKAYLHVLMFSFLQKFLLKRAPSSSSPPFTRSFDRGFLMKKLGRLLCCGFDKIVMLMNNNTLCLVKNYG
ncbi:unnamed protein product [Lactuca virosa]|uniref:Uncharacterized protein n=1 Tax=Lactuca virosa TaxID=75947 RepID=A0AAU9N026_9ASTR|nr:unnamed protein product [Lactuca virosa]